MCRSLCAGGDGGGGGKGEGRKEGMKTPKKSSRKILVAETPVKFQITRIQPVVSESPGNVIKESPRRSFYSSEFYSSTQTCCSSCTVLLCDPSGKVVSL